MTDSRVTADVRDGVLTVRFTRPDVLNALSADMLRTATESVRAAAADDTVRAVLLTGTGRAFSSGADLAPETPGDDPDSEQNAPQLATLDAAASLVAEIVALPKPVVASVNGLAAGVGATIALSCDLVVAASSAYFLLAFANIGLMPDGGATAIVPAAIGRARAARMALLGERLPAATAFEWGLVSHLVDDADLGTEVAALTAKLAGGATLAYARTKAALTQHTLGDLADTHAIERAGQLALFGTHDFTEGVAAFRERRPATFTGN
jgi:enoyl-CoA hydratase